MGDRVPFVVGILAIVGVVAWLVLRDGDDTKPARAPAAGSSERAITGAAKVSAPEGPSLPRVDTPTPTLPTTSPSPSAEETFELESRDDAWADKTEVELTRRWQKVRGGKLEGTECRQSQCRLVIGGSENEVATAIADLEGPRGLHGYAQGILLSGPERTGDGAIKLRAYVRFDR